MEKRLFLAIGLSVLVVWLYSFNAPKPLDPSSQKKTSETIGIKEDTVISKEIEGDISSAGILEDLPEQK